VHHHRNGHGKWGERGPGSMLDCRRRAQFASTVQKTGHGGAWDIPGGGRAFQCSSVVIGIHQVIQGSRVVPNRLSSTVLSSRGCDDPFNNSTCIRAARFMCCAMRLTTVLASECFIPAVSMQLSSRPLVVWQPSKRSTCVPHRASHIHIQYMSGSSVG
jgi:hypothetical protein